MNVEVEYLVVEFIERGSTLVDVIPGTWLNALPDDSDLHCLWPSHLKDSLKINAAAKRGEAPSDKWKRYKVNRILFRTTSWEKAQAKAEKSEYTSSLETSEDEARQPSKRRRRSPNRWGFDEDTEEESLFFPLEVGKGPSSSGSRNAREKEQSSCNVAVPPPSTSGCSISNNGPRKSQTLENVPKPPPRPNTEIICTPPRHLPNSNKEVSPTGQRLPPRTCSSAAGSPFQVPPTQTRPTGSNVAAFERVFNLLERIVDKQQSQDRVLQRISECLQQQQQPNDVDDPAVDLPQLPCSSMEELRTLEELLASSETARKKLVRVLSLMGGTKLSNVVSNMMKGLVGSELARMLNPSGVRGKAPFNQFKTVNKLLARGVRKLHEFKNATDAAINDAISKWFTNSRDRGNNNRKETTRRRAEPAAAAAGAPNVEENDDQDEH